ncbi:adenylosuccinate lyase [Arcanobacterium wilhelmae]|uniref:Adenylosuccinate lyase n=1 Tax=Arcanobacterium wilhelmae TaxID=1803177 RepID=A0ABT9NDE2_9ACTO|nr:adenylosuccinate lyase [Arcanobacterium wilhelmae]MDP9801543.1 adenylosuccinate lyase [Arcanobacterium wilhelmae]WFN90870.1 adenylosuccinate lyase [Arcanobacterium wilhelmae]
MSETKNRYVSPLGERYASETMMELFSPRTRVATWRKLWVSLARAQHELGLPVSAQQVAALEAAADDIRFDVIEAREAEVRHDVMANVYSFGQVAPEAAGIIHLGATSCYVTDNADLVIYRDALDKVREGLVAVIANLADFADSYKAMPTLGYTHYQPAQLVTVGKRATLWLQDFMADLEELDFVVSTIKFLGCRGTTGTEASFVELFDGDGGAIDEMNRRIADDFGFNKLFDVAGQTYPRKFDARIMSVLAGVATSAYRMAQDIRLLQHDRQVEEPFEAHQIGSSAMPYKRNPMRTERICSLARYVIADAANASATASAQWLERTLDDSANRRISVPEAFLGVDAILKIAANVTFGLHVNDAIVAKAVRDYLPFIATENILMEGVKRGGDRQELHEIIREESLAATAKMKVGEPFDLLGALAEHPEFGMSPKEFAQALDPSAYIGRCPQQVDAYLEKVRAVIGEQAKENPQLAV